MRKIKLCTTTQKIIYEAMHSSLQDAIESAIEKNIPLNGIDLSYCNLRHINLDGVCIRDGSFKESDLSGANMSEAQFKDCDFSGAEMADTCLCYSDIKGCNFKYTGLVGADISMAVLESCDFQGDSLTYLNFHRAHKLSDLNYIYGQKAYKFSTPPSLFRSAGNFVFILDSTVICGTNTHTLVWERHKHTSKQSREVAQL